MSSSALATHSFQPGCSACSLSAMCVPLSLSDSEIDELDVHIRRGAPLGKNHHILRTGEDFKGIYAVRSGAVKTYRVTDNGEEQILGFSLPGEVFGLDGIGRDQYRNSVTTLERSSICEIPYARIQELGQTMPVLYQRVLQLMNTELSDDQDLLILLSQKNAESRIASFLLSVSARYGRRNLSRTQFRLPMTRSDIANYLGLVLETVSRTMTRLQNRNIIANQGREVEILDMEMLKELSRQES